MAGPSLPSLIGFPLSHYCEKARWGLQRCGIPFSEEAHIPGLHRGHVRAAGGAGSVPCLRLPAEQGGGCVDESTPILKWADEQSAARAAAAAEGSGREGAPPPPLFPSDPGQRAQVEELVAEFDQVLGPAARVWAYSHLLYTQPIEQAMAAPPVPAWEGRLLRWGFWYLLRGLMKRGMDISPEHGERCLARIRGVFDRVGALLQDGRPFLVGGAFTAADLTFAALAAPALGQPYNNAAPGLGEATPPGMRAVVEELRGHAAGRHALRMWESQRGVVLGGA